MSRINKNKKVLRTIVNTSWYVRNEDLRNDLKISVVEEKIGRYARNVKKEGCWNEQRRKHATDLAKEIK